MDENETPKQEEKQTETSTDWSGVLKKAEELAARIETANKESSRILAQQQELAARNLLGGRTEAGVQPPQVQVESPKDYAKRVMSGKL